MPDVHRAGCVVVLIVGRPRAPVLRHVNVHLLEHHVVELRRGRVQARARRVRDLCVQGLQLVSFHKGGQVRPVDFGPRRVGPCPLLDAVHHLVVEGDSEGLAGLQEVGEGHQACTACSVPQVLPEGLKVRLDVLAHAHQGALLRDVERVWGHHALHEVHEVDLAALLGVVGPQERAEILAGDLQVEHAQGLLKLLVGDVPAAILVEVLEGVPQLRGAALTALLNLVLNQLLQLLARDVLLEGRLPRRLAGLVARLA